ncbi:sensor histidine kinase [Nocardioides sp. B-3]|uniref:sensor histidine kinase n=1 Tax=Nocardioides sp. B-3 TaxID=2895565 RepID=UPI0021522C98|nr:sensor histidine kinase [Nocardioides sp. B-3]UUZ60525.1 sensor histidine kinase [Nocardioides sp. B-3]
MRESAPRVARQDLPDAVARIRSGSEPGPIKSVDVHTREEVGQLARAVDDLHQQAVTLASGEAKLRTRVGEMFVTLSRRNTTLINQQLNLIEALESDEEDPKRLESLFRLDHLAARMRRTADSLLILADAPTRSAGWESVSIAETLQAATAGVTDYQRVRIESTLPLPVNESAAGDLVHMVTELVDNSLSYSSPHTSVVLGATETDNGVTITVTDSGLGIPVDELRQINENLRTGVEVTPDTARRMGLFVVSRLAQRHGVTVTLKANTGDGTTAFVHVPNAILPARAHIDPVEAEVEAVVEETPAEVVETQVLSAGAVEESDDTELPAPTKLPVRGSAEVDASDPLGIGDSHLSSNRGLPTRERGATLSHLTAAGLQLPTGGDEDTAEPEAPREVKRATGAMPLRSKRDLTVAPAVVAVPDLPKDEAEVEVEAPIEDEVVTETFVEEPVHEETVHEPAVEETVHEPVPEPEPQPEPEALVEEEPEETPESHIAALMAKIRPQRGRLPIPDYEDVDHAAILQMPMRDRGSLGDPLTDPLPPEDDEAVEAVAEVEAVEESWLEDTTEAPAAIPVSEPVFDTETAPTYSEAVAPTEVEQPAPYSAQVEEPAINGSAGSSWLSTDEEDRARTSTEVEAGWARADTVAETHDEATNDSGLPVRRPGARLVPGSVTKPVGAAGRDPEAIRARLSAHKAGVRRGRTASVPADDQ